MSDEIKKNSPSEDVLKELEEQEVVVNQPTAETPVEPIEPATEEVEKEENSAGEKPRNHYFECNF